MKILLCSNNKDKVKEIKKINPNVEVVSLKYLSINIDIEETSNTFSGNATLKIKALLDSKFKSTLDKHNITHLLSDDSGLCVDALYGNPGVYSARFMGEDTTATQRNLSIIESLRESTNRKAYMITVGILYNLNTGETKEETGTINGIISTEERGTNGFDYDSIFIPSGSELTFGEMSPEEKASYSSRTEAFKPLLLNII